MDSITHIALGGLVGEIVLGKQLGKRCLILGALAQSLPDVDFVASLWLDTTDNLMAHRGFTHSFLFVAMIAPLLAWLARRWYKSYDITLQRWMFFFGVQCLIHLLIDSLNAYGIGWFEPFSHERISFHVLFVADPFYSVWLGVAFLILLALPMRNSQRQQWAWAGLVLSSIYISYALINKAIVDQKIHSLWDSQGISSSRYFSTPTPFNSWLWFVVEEDDKGFRTGYRSVFDKGNDMTLNHFLKNDSLFRKAMNYPGIDKLLRFSKGYYTVEQRSDTLVFNDLRFGQQVGWHDPTAGFVFQYYVNYPDANRFVLQRGRFARWDRTTVGAMYDRIKGN